jgi:signal transduction histidine kinase
MWCPMSSRGSRGPMHAGVGQAITLRFTALVTAVLIAGVVAYAVADAVATSYGLDRDLERRATRALRLLDRRSGTAAEESLGEIRLLDASGRILQANPDLGGLALAERPAPGFSTLAHPDGAYRVLTVSLEPPREGASFLQVASPSRLDVADLWEKVLVLLGVTALVSGLTYVIGIGFARGALSPVHDTLSRLEQFTADAGHELRTPLASIRASLDVAERTGDLAGCLPEARAELTRASDLVERLLEMARLDALTVERTTVVLCEAITRAAEPLQTLAARRSVVIDASPGDPRATVEADPILLERLIANLLENAVKFSDAGAAVTVRYDRASLTVHNHGQAIPPDALERVVDPFVQADASRAGDGFGLGLAIVTSIARIHGWAFRLESDSSVGTTASVRFDPGR